MNPNPRFAPSLSLGLSAVLLLAACGPSDAQGPSRRSLEASRPALRALVAELGAPDALRRAEAACGLEDLGDVAFEAMTSLEPLLGDERRVENARVCQGGNRFSSGAGES